MSHESEHNPGDALAESQIAQYPAEWDSDARCSAYWWALGRGLNVRSTAGWYEVQRDSQASADRRQRRLSHLRSAAHDFSEPRHSEKA